MGRPRKNAIPTDPQPETPATASEPETVVEIPSARPTARKPRIIIHYDETGKPDLSRLDPSAASALSECFRTQAPATATDPELVGMLLAGITSLECAIVARQTKLDPLEVAPAFSAPPPLADAIAGAAARIIDKYNLVGRWGDEVALLALIATWQAGAFAQIRNLKARKAEENAARGNMGQAQAGEEHLSSGAGASTEN